MNNVEMNNSVLVCVTKQKTCEALIEMGSEIRNKSENSDLYILHVTKSKTIGTDDNISYLFNVSSKYDANMSIIFNNSFLNCIEEFVKKNQIKHIVLGETRQSDKSNSTMFKIKEKFDEFVDITVLPVQENIEYENII